MIEDILLGFMLGVFVSFLVFMIWAKPRVGGRPTQSPMNIAELYTKEDLKKTETATKWPGKRL